MIVSTDADYTFTVAANLALVATFAPPPIIATAPAPSGVNVMTLSWPAARLGWSLEESPDFVTWTPSARVITTTAGQNTVTVPTTGGSRFFRLAHP